MTVAAADAVTLTYIHNRKRNIRTAVAIKHVSLLEPLPEMSADRLRVTNKQMLVAHRQYAPPCARLAMGLGRIHKAQMHLCTPRTHIEEWSQLRKVR